MSALTMGTVKVMNIFLSTMVLLLVTPPSLGQADNRLPKIKFGNFFHVSFDVDTLQRFYECLCDIHIVQCLLSYKIRDGASLSQLPYHMRAFNVRQVRISSKKSTLYSKAFTCDILHHSPNVDDLNCYRPTDNDNTCKNDARCVTYSVPLNYSTCTFHCPLLVWLNAFSFPLEFENYGDFPKPVKNDKCLVPDVPLSPKKTTTSNDFISFFSDNTSTPNSTKENNRDSSPFPIPIAAGVGSCLVVMSVAAFVMHRIKHRKQKVKYPKETNPSAPMLGAIDSLNSTSVPKNPSNSSQPEEVHYETIDEVADGSRDKKHVLECDNDGYNIIQDCMTELQEDGSRAERERRPLPVVPSDSISKSTVTLTTGLYSTIPSHPPSIPDITSPQSPAISDPVLHRRAVDLNKHEEMGLINIQGDHPAFKGHTRVKLVRTEWGEMELISLEDEPVFSDYYSRLQLISLKDSAVGVVGLTGKLTDTEFYDIFKTTEAEKKVFLKNGSSLENVSNQIVLDKNEQKPSDSPTLASELPNPYVNIVFFGPLEMYDSSRILVGVAGQCVSVCAAIMRISTFCAPSISAEERGPVDLVGWRWKRMGRISLDCFLQVPRFFF
ncbi:hypothetical protein PoB_001618600, partial [Plakobranchus ocellatus]